MLLSIDRQSLIDECIEFGTRRAPLLGRLQVRPVEEVGEPQLLHEARQDLGRRWRNGNVAVLCRKRPYGDAIA